MRISIKLDGRKNVQNADGFPIIIYITGFKSKQSEATKKQHVINTGYRSKKMHWDKSNALPKTKHPNFVELLNYLEQKKITIQKILAEDRVKPLSLYEAETRITQNDSDIFYNHALEYCKNRAYRNALNSFNKMFPNESFSKIDKKMARRYMQRLLVTPVRNKERSPNGVYSYMDKLTALWNFCDKPDNPFKGVRPEKEHSKNKALTTSDLIKVRDNDYLVHANSSGGGRKEFLDYFMLGFYLGGVDLGDLSRLRYDQNVVNNRVEFYRSKGSKKKAFISNVILPEAQELMDKYKTRQYLIPLRNNLIYENYCSNLSREFKNIKDYLELTKKPYTKAPRYSFITRAQNLLIDQRITMKIVGHLDGSTHGIYTDVFPQHIQDKAHKKIVDLSINAENYEPIF